MKNNIMKHIVPKTIITYKTTFDFNDIKEEDIPEKSKKIAKRLLESDTYEDDYDIMVHTANNKATFGFDYLYKNERKFIPELDPSVIYFSSAQLFSEMIYHYKKELLKNSYSLKDIAMKKPGQSLDDTVKKFQTFFQFASSYVVMLSASLEAFINKMIPIDHVYTTIKKSENKNIDWILKESIEFKMTKIIPVICGKDYPTENPDKYDSILKIKTFRNELIHLSPKNEITNTKYKDFYRKVIDFKYSEAIYSIRDYINYHEKGLIEECTCGNKFCFDVVNK